MIPDGAFFHLFVLLTETELRASAKLPRNQILAINEPLKAYPQLTCLPAHVRGLQVWPHESLDSQETAIAPPDEKIKTPTLNFLLINLP